MAGALAVGAAGRGWGSSYAGSAGRRSCVPVGTRCSPPAVRGGSVARGVRGRALSPLRLPSSWGLSGPAAHVLWARLCGYGVCCEGRLRSGAPPPPTVRPLGGLSVQLHSCCGRGCAGVGARRCPLSLNALEGPRSAGVVGAVSGGVARHRCEGRLVPGAAPPPVARPRAAPHSPTPGRHFSPDRKRAPEGSAPATRREPGRSTTGRRLEREQGGRGATPPPPPPPHRPASHGGPGPHPPRQKGWTPPPERGAGV